MEPHPFIQTMGFIVVCAMMLLSIVITIELVYRYLTDPRDSPTRDVLHDYRRQQADLRRQWEDYRRNTNKE